MRRQIVESLGVLLLTSLGAYMAVAGEPPSAMASPASGDAALCPSAAYLTLEAGRIVAVDWFQYAPGTVHTVSILNQSRILDATVDIRDDQTSGHSSVVLSVAGEKPDDAKIRDLGTGAIYWSDMIASSVAQAVARARVLNQPVARIAAASLFADTRGEVEVDRVDETDWTVSYHNKKYFVLTDRMGCMLSATLADYGVTIERRLDFSRSEYPLWTPYGAPPDNAYTARDVKIAAPQGHTLAGTLTLPRAGKNLAAVVLITGLSPSERNGGLPPWMPLRDIADILTRAGIAVLRVDDRGIGESTGDHDPSTTFDEANDVNTEVAWLRAQARIDRHRIFLIGYSEGGLIAPMIAARDRTIAGIVTLAGSGVSGDELAREQTEEAVVRDPTIPASDRENEIKKRLAEPLTPREKSFLAVDPLAFASQVRCPALIVQGGADITVPIRSAERLANAMRRNGNRDVTVRIVTGVSHSLLPDPVGLNTEWAWLPAFVTSPGVLSAVSDWITLHRKK
jgi:pimeloyl-ACP methyl ester carboxylesterase